MIPDFTNYFKTLSNTELLVILNEPAKYQPEALQAAKNELEGRNLSHNQVNEAKQAIITTQLKAGKRLQRVKEMDEKLKANANFLNDTLRPGANKTVDKTINGISIFVGLTSLVSVYVGLRSILFFTNWSHRFSAELAVELLMPLMGVVAAVLFFRRRQLGWHLLMLCLFYSSSGLAFLVYDFFKYGSLSFGGIFSQHTSPLSYLLLLAWPVSIVMVCKEKLRVVFGITKNNMYVTMAWCCFIVVMVLYIIFVV